MTDDVLADMVADHGCRASCTPSAVSLEAMRDAYVMNVPASTLGGKIHARAAIALGIDAVRHGWHIVAEPSRCHRFAEAQPKVSFAGA